jgi:hypothetical protein
MCAPPFLISAASYLLQAVNCIGTKRGSHKYEAVLCAILNLPKRKRCSFDYLLCLGLWQTKFSKSVGGAARMLCGVGSVPSPLPSPSSPTPLPTPV